MKTILVIMALIAFQMVGMARSKPAQRKISAEKFLVDRTEPYVYLQVDHVGPRGSDKGQKSQKRIWLRLHNNCIIPITVRTSGVPPNSPADEIGVLYEVVANAARGIGGSSLGQGQALPIPPGLAAVLNIPGQRPPASSVPPQKAEAAGMPDGDMPDVSSFEIIGPGQSIYFSLPINRVSPKWHVEIPFRFDLKIRSPIRSAYNFVALYEEDVAAKMNNSGLR